MDENQYQLYLAIVTGFFAVVAKAIEYLIKRRQYREDYLRRRKSRLNKSRHVELSGDPADEDS